MTNEEKVKEIAELCDTCIESNGFPCRGCESCESRGLYYGALEMAEWKDKQFSTEKQAIIEERAIDIGYLQDWYQNSIDETIPPIWTDAHIDELFKDFYLIPKK